MNFVLSKTKNNGISADVFLSYIQSSQIKIIGGDSNTVDDAQDASNYLRLEDVIRNESVSNVIYDLTFGFDLKFYLKLSSGAFYNVTRITEGKFKIRYIMEK